MLWEGDILGIVVRGRVCWGWDGGWSWDGGLLLDEGGAEEVIVAEFRIYIRVFGVVIRDGICGVRRVRTGVVNMTSRRRVMGYED